MVSKIFIDANIILDFTLQRAGYDVAEQIIQLIEGGQVNAFISPAIVHIISYWLTKAYGKQKCREILLNLLTDVKVIDADHKITIDAIHSKIDDVEDALQYFTAIHHKLNYFITNDKQLKKHSVHTLPIYTPGEFVNNIYIG